MDAKEIEQARKSIDEIIDGIEDVMDGKNIGCIISAFILLLAELYDEEVMPKELYIKSIAASLEKYLSDDSNEGETLWLH